MAAETDVAQMAAFLTYDSIRDELLSDARKAERDRRPLTARRMRYYASLVARAADAEEVNPRPSGMVASHDDDVREGWR